MKRPHHIPAVSVTYAQTGCSTKNNSLGMRPMQERAYEKRGEQYLLIKSPPASGKSRALMFIALDKLYRQNLRQAVIVVPEKAIGASFESANLSSSGFFYDWTVIPRWNLCNAPGTDGSKVNSVKKFLESDDNVLICTHATFRFSCDKLGFEVFDNRLIAIDEFHHVSANPDNVLGSYVSKLMTRDSVHIVAMTGSYFRGDAEPVLDPADEERFDTVTFDYCEQLNGYRYLKYLDIGYFFYTGSYVDSIMEVLNENEKTIIHIPNVNSRESTKDKCREVEEIMSKLGDWIGVDNDTGFQQVRTPAGNILRIADLVDDTPARREKVSLSLRDPSQQNNPDHVDIIIALGMAKEGFDWIWCEHALTVGYRSSLTEVVQIIGRATRDAKGKTRARFTNLIAEPDATEEAVAEAVNDTLKAIASSLLMEQVLTPRFDFVSKNSTSGPIDGVDYGESGYEDDVCNIGVDPKDGSYKVEIKGLVDPTTAKAKYVCDNDIDEVITKFLQDKEILERGIFDENTIPQDVTQVGMGKIVRNAYPEFCEEDQEAIRQRAVLALNLKQVTNLGVDNHDGSRGNTVLIEGLRKYAMDVRDLDIDLIDRISPFGQAYAIMAKAISEDTLGQVASVISARRVKLSPDEARDLVRRAKRFLDDHNRLPSIKSLDPWERRMAEGIEFMRQMEEEPSDG